VVLIGHSLGGLIATRFVQRNKPDLTALVLSGPVVGGNPQVEVLLGMDPMPEVPIGWSTTGPSTGRRWRRFLGPRGRAVAADPGFGDLPTLWIHGEGDVLAPLDATTEAMRHLRGSNIEEHVYPGAQHEMLNEINKEEVLDDVVRFLRGALGLRPSS
jgi:alpha-beta hydrolase superfamily lysophospholipase